MHTAWFQRTTYALLLMPNILMDALQIARGELPWTLWRRLTPLLAATVVGVFLGTKILVTVPERAIFIYRGLLASTPSD